MMNVRAYALGFPVLLSLTAYSALGTAQTIKADHTTVDTSVLSSESLSDAQALRMSFSHASVGGYIWAGLIALADENPSLAFPNWANNSRGNPDWQAKIDDFETWVSAHLNEFDVFQNKFCYIDQAADFAAYRDSMVSLRSQYPDKVFVYWTMPLMTDNADNSLRQAFNEQVRAHCASNDLPLYDVADIESHTVAGAAVTNAGFEAMDPAQSLDGGHPNELGAARAAAAQWALMAQIAGHGVTAPSTGGSASTGGATASNGTSGTTVARGGAAATVTTGGAAATNGTDEASDSGEDSGCSVAGTPRKGTWLFVLGVALFSVFARKKR